MSTRPPEPPAMPDPLRIVNGIRFRRHAPSFFLDALRRYGDASRFYLVRRKVYLLFGPDYAERVLGTNAPNYPRAGYDKLASLLGAGLLSSEGEAWRVQRKIAQPAFTPQRLRGVVGALTAAVEDSSERLDRAAEAAAPVDVEQEMNRLALAMLGRTMFGKDFSASAAGVNDALRYVLHYGTKRIGNPLALPPSVPTPKNRRHRKALARLDEVVYALIDERRRRGGNGEDLLSSLVETPDPRTGVPMDDRLLRDNVMTFLTAGHETTAKALTWSLYLTHRHPAHAETVREEARRTLAYGTLDHARLSELVHTERFAREAIRLYTPVPALARKVLEDDEVGGYRIVGGSRVIVSPYATHRHPGFWEYPERFEPERFTPENSKERHHYAYLPFGRGPRQCIASNFALMEMRVALATLLSRFSFSAVGDGEPDTEALFTLRPRNGMPMHIARVT
ncbi:MAG: cytochrome P450 [Actinomycetota bacterium]|nr:cytochrome P450 [Actinomycetota bacterium]